ncbi:MAG TPA: zinc-dependent alcohol dehydrogenase family protein [Desulfomonilaceae bacterium]|nr:zinc-dependent alcohol dehydrogenase family protein [Desulfomonilaceae bacterium]
MVLKSTSNIRENRKPLQLSDMPEPVPGEKDILIKVSACGVCHTELDEIEGRTPPSVFPVVPGHQVVGQVTSKGKKVTKFRVGERVGVGWIFSACGHCSACLEGNENVCEEFRATGRDVNGGYARFMTVSEDFAYPIPAIFSDVEAAPLLCAGAIGYRSLRLANLTDGEGLGLTGFGASAHLVLKMVRHKYPNSRVSVFARSEKEQAFARELGAVWAGDTEDEPPEKLHAIIDTTPAWKPVVQAMKNLKSGGRLVINAIRKEEADKDCLLKLNYPTHLWLEKEIKSVANVARKDISEFLQLAAEIPIRPEVQEFSMAEANEALVELKEARIRGAKVLRMD